MIVMTIVARFTDDDDMRGIIRMYTFTSSFGLAEQQANYLYTYGDDTGN